VADGSSDYLTGEDRTVEMMLRDIDAGIPGAHAGNGEHEISRCIETMARAVAAGIAEPFPKPE
jgi:hypothetical protein